MKMLKKGETVEVTVTYLEMDTAPTFTRPHAPVGEPVALMRAKSPPVWYFLFLYRTVGAQYEWVQRLEDDPGDLDDFVSDDKVGIYTLLRGGWPAGFFMLDWRKEGVTDLSYFGLVPDAVGQGLGSWLLKTAILTAWDVPGTQRVTVNTCTLDHPRALAQYQTARISARFARVSIRATLARGLGPVDVSVTPTTRPSQCLRCFLKPPRTRSWR